MTTNTEGLPHFSYCRNYFLSMRRTDLNKKWSALPARVKRKHGGDIKNWYWPTLRAEWDGLSQAKQIKIAAQAERSKQPKEQMAKLGRPKRKLASDASEINDDPLPGNKISKVQKIFDNSPAEHRLLARADFIASLQTSVMIGALLRKAHGIFVMYFLHGLYEPDITLTCSMILKDLPVDPTRSRKTTTDLLETALAKADAWKGRKGFPYRWIPDGVEIWREMLPHWPQIWLGCVTLATLRAGCSYVKVDSDMPLGVGSTYSSLGYMRRHLGRNIHVYLDGTCDGPADWALCWDGMGDGPRNAVTLLKCQSFVRCSQLIKALGSRTTEPYSMHDLTCFLCLKLPALKRATA